MRQREAHAGKALVLSLTLRGDGDIVLIDNSRVTIGIPDGYKVSEKDQA